MNKFIVLLAAGSLTGISLRAQKTLLGFSKPAAEIQFATEQSFDRLLSAKNIDQYIKDLSARPHHVASPGGDANTAYIAAKFRSWGYDTKVETFDVLFPTPVTRVLEMTGSKKFTAALKEPALAEDATSGQDGQLPVYNCWSADGDVTAELVYVNYGVPADYEMLERLGIDVKGKIVIAKYGRSWRGIKPKLAQEHGAVGCIIYSDPKEDGYYNGDVYPNGPYRPALGAQRGSVEDMPVYPGDPLTPGIGAVKDAPRIERKDAANLLKIPVIPIGYADALPLLESLEGSVVPEDWRGALPITYHTGPSKNKVHLQLSFEWKIRPVHNIIATLKGSSLPDEWIIRGNHHDAWVNGAADPVSGLAALLEEARVIGEMARKGIKPQRTIVYCAWDGEEPGLLGSTEWVEQHAGELQQKAALYINSDGNGRGFLYAGGSHALEPFFTEISKDVTDPQKNVSVFERKKSADIISAAGKTRKDAMNKKVFSLAALGSGSDYSPFFQHLGINSLNVGFGGEDNGGEYHSVYDSYDLYRRFKDPTFEYGVALAQICGRTTLRFANAGILPFDFRSLQKTIGNYATEVTALVDDMRENTTTENLVIKGGYYTVADNITASKLPPALKDEVPFLNFSSLQNAVAALEKSCVNLNDSLMTENMHADKRQLLNKKLFRAEQALLTTGLPRRPWYRHSIYAPGFYTGYGVKTLPGIREAVEQRNWKEAQEQIEITAAAINHLANYLQQIVADLR